MRLSLARASAVRVALQGRGVDASRLLARASGSMAPRCVQQNETCRASERAVEFITLPGAKPAAAPPPPPDNPEAGAPSPDDKPPAGERAPSAMPLERIEFNRGSAVLAPSALANLDLLAGFMKANAVSLEIVGYADERERGVATLAQARADAVRGYMMACGVSGAHLVTRAERTGRATCRSHSAKCPARDSRASWVVERARGGGGEAGNEGGVVGRDGSREQPLERRRRIVAEPRVRRATAARPCCAAWTASGSAPRATAARSGPRRRRPRTRRGSRRAGRSRRRRPRRAPARAGAVVERRCGSRGTPPPGRTGSRRR